MNEVPIVILCHNNEYYVNNTIIQLEKYHDNLIILDNCSDDSETLNYLYNISLKYKVIKTDVHREPFKARNYVFDQLPEYFCFTDPDLEYNKNLPYDFIKKLIEISNKHNVHKVGFSLKISDFNEMYQDKYFLDKNIFDWEVKWWRNKIKDELYDLYDAEIDTTFALYNKNIQAINNNSLRIGGNFICKHLPWYPANNQKINKHILNKMYKKSTWSTIANSILKTHI